MSELGRKVAAGTTETIRSIVMKNPLLGAEVVIVALFLGFLLVLGYGARSVFSRGVDALEASTAASHKTVTVLEQLASELQNREKEHDRIENLIRDQDRSR